MTKGDAYEELANALDRLTGYEFKMPESIRIDRGNTVVLFSMTPLGVWTWDEYVNAGKLNAETGRTE